MSETYTERAHDYEPHRLEICGDCLQILANGSLGGHAEPRTTEEVVADMAYIWGGNLGQITLGRLQDEDETTEHFEEYLSGWGDDSDDSAGFSMSSCEGCGSGLGGDRYYATAWLPIEDKNPDQDIFHALRWRSGGRP